MLPLEEAMEILEIAVRKKYWRELRINQLPEVFRNTFYPKQKLPENLMHENLTLAEISTAHWNYASEFEAFSQNNHLIRISITTRSPEQMVIYVFTKEFFRKEVIFQIPGQFKSGEVIVFVYNNLIGELTDVLFYPSAGNRYFARWSKNNDPCWRGKIIEDVSKEESPLSDLLRKTSGDTAAIFKQMTNPCLDETAGLAQIMNMPINLTEIQTIGSLKILWQVDVVSIAKYLSETELEI